MTDPGVVKGKFSYLSPEAASGLDVDHRADVFAVGIILWELFTGKRLFYGDTDYQTVELVRQAKIPSIRQHNPDVEPELEAVVQKALERDADDRYQSAADLGDALAQFLFSRRMKVTARDISALVKDTQVELMRKRSAEPKESLIDGLIMDEMTKMTSLLPGNEQHGGGPEGAASLDPSSFVDTSHWAGDLMQSQQGNQRAPQKKGNTKPPPNKAKSLTPTNPGGGEVESLEQMLEPDRTGMHKRGESKPPWAIIIIVMVLLAAGAAVAVVFAMG